MWRVFYLPEKLLPIVLRVALTLENQKAKDTASRYDSKMEIGFLEPDLTDYGQEGGVSQLQDI